MVIQGPQIAHGNLLTAVYVLKQLYELLLLELKHINQAGDGFYMQGHKRVSNLRTTLVI